MNGGPLSFPLSSGRWFYIMVHGEKWFTDKNRVFALLCLRSVPVKRVMKMAVSATRDRKATISHPLPASHLTSCSLPWGSFWHNLSTYPYGLKYTHGPPEHTGWEQNSLECHLSNPAPSYLPRDMKTYVHSHSYMHVHHSTVQIARSRGNWWIDRQCVL